MSGLYLHIPFCRQACHYCDFHFSTVQKSLPDLMGAMRQELRMRAAEILVKRLDRPHIWLGVVRCTDVAMKTRLSVVGRP